MNRTFKVVFNKARGALTVVNEITSSVQKASTKSVVAAAVAMVLTAPAMAVEHSYEQSSNNTGYDSTAEAKVFAEGDTLKMTITGTDNTRAYGLLATGEGAVYTNKGTIETNLATENATPAYRVKAMMADNGGKAVNEGTINVTNAYGMTVGSTGKNTLVNSGAINVEGGVGMEVAPTGIAGSGTTPGANATATNEADGTISVTNGVGVLMSGNTGVFTNRGTINAQDQTAVMVYEENETSVATGNSVTLASGSTTNGKILVQGYTWSVEENGEKVTKVNQIESTSITIEDGATFNGSISVRNATGTVVNASADFKNQSGSNGSAIFFNDSTGKLDLSGSVFDGNVAGQIGDSKKATGAGGAIYSYADTFTQTGGEYKNNKAVSTGYNGNSSGVCQDGAMGGALLIKGNSIVLTDVGFTNNSAVANKTDNTQGGAAYGGAIVVDYSTGNGDGTGLNRDADLTIKITQDMTYAGNTVSSDSTAESFDTFGYHVPTAQAGGFLFLDRGSVAAFDIADGATLTIGQSNTQINEDDDSIASSIPNQVDKDPVNGGKHAQITKTGAGTLVINGTLNKYYGDLVVGAGRMEVNSQWDIKNVITVEGGTLALSDFSFDDSAHAEDAQVNLGKITIKGGGLEVASGQVFKKAAATDSGMSTEAGEFAYSKDKIEIVSGGSLVLNDAQYVLDYANDAQTALNEVNEGAKLIMLGQIVDKEGNVETDLGLNDVANVSGDTILAGTTVSTGDTDLTIGTDGNRTESLGVASINLGTANGVTVTGQGKELTLVGTGADDALITSTGEEDLEVAVQSQGTLNLGTKAVSNGGVLNATVNVAESSTVNAVGASTYTVDGIDLQAETSALNVTEGSTLELEKLTGLGVANVGNAESAAELSIQSIEGFKGIIFADPDWAADASLNTVDRASHVDVGEVGTTGLTAGLVAGRNSVISVGAAGAVADAAFGCIAEANGLSWGKDGVTAMVYLDAPISIDTATGSQGAIVVDGSLTSIAGVSVGDVSVASKGMLIVNQANAKDGAYITGEVTFNEGSYLGIVNAAEGTFILADSENLTGTVVTDNPFISGSLNAGTVTNKLDTENGLKSIASLGLQAVTRRADSVLAATIADRTSFGQELKPGMNLWVDVAGENYKMDAMDHGAEFEADMGYGTFGGDVAIGQFTVGGALQYGTGSLRSSVSGIKNDIDNYAVSLYGTYSVTDAFKLGAELAYVWGENDITSDQTALNQSVDTEMYSAGIRAMYELKAGDFSFVPSIGLRVSQLSTDAMKVGTVRIEDQDQTLVQIPIAMRISAGDFATQSGWMLSPSFKIAYVPTFGDKEIDVIGSEADVIDTNPVQMDFGLFAGRDNLLLSAAFSMGAGKEGSSSVGGKIGLKYAF